jgi:outer membrane immunogenic protein
MKRLAYGMIGCIAWIVAAEAADFPDQVPAAPPRYAAVAPPPAAFSWTATYAGIHGGGGWLSVGTATGWLGGGQLGFNYQFPNNFVVGLELDGSFATIGYDVSAPGIFNEKVSFSPLATARFRLGYAIDRLLPYFTIGGAYVGYSDTVTFICLGCGILNTKTTENKFGVSAGFGAEYAVVHNLSVKAEYIYSYVNGPSVFGIRTTNEIQTVRLGINVLLH